MKKFVLFSIISIMAICSCFVGCKSNGGKDGQKIESNVPSHVQGAIHKYDMTNSGEFIIKDGASDYTIVYPENAGADVRSAANELSVWLFKASGKSIPTIVDSNLQYTDSAKYISVGKTTLSEQAEVSYDKNQIGEKGYIIKTIGKSVFVIGETDSANLNGAYGLLRLTIGFDTYGIKMSTFDKSIKNIPLYNYDVIDAPDIATNVNYLGFLDAELVKKWNFSDSNWLKGAGGNHTGFVFYFQPEIYSATHPKWYSSNDGDDNLDARDGTQVCFLAHGDAAEYEAMLVRAVDVIKTALKNDPVGTRVSISLEDSADWCICPACTASKEKYGANSATVIQFLNILDDRIFAWFETEEGAPYKRELEFSFLAYLPLVDAPDQVDDSVKLNEHVRVFFAPMNGAFNRSFYDAANEEAYTQFLEWSAISKELYVWTYNTNFHDYLVPYNSFANFQGNFKAMVENKTVFLLHQDQYTNGASTGFSALKGYLLYKLSWDCNLNMEELIDEYFEVYFGDAGEAMRKCFEALRANFAHSEYYTDFGSWIYDSPLREDVYSKSFLLQSLEYIDQALESIEYLKNIDSTEYERIVKAITLESMTYRYMLIQIYGKEIKESDLIKMKESFRSDAQLVNLTQKSEGAPIDMLYSSWGI